MNFFTDKQAKRYYFSLAVLLIIFIILTQILSYLSMNLFKREMLSHDYRIAGYLIQKYPDMSSGIKEAFITDKNTSHLDTGRDLLEPTGYKTDIQINLVPELLQMYQKNRIAFLLSAFVLAAAILLLTFLFLYKHYQTLDQYGNDILQILNGKKMPRMKDQDEGSLSKLAASVNMVTSSLYTHAEKEKENRVFLKDTLVNISHQFKTPISALSMYNEIMQQDCENSEVIRSFLQKSENELIRMQNLTASLLKLARLDAGVIELNRANHSLNSIILELAESFRERLDRESKTFALEAKTEVLYHCDREWMLEALSNLLKNAIEHTKPGDFIRFTLEHSSLFVKITVEDSGEGIHPEDIHFVFQRFYRSRFSQNKQGTGIGLTLTKAVIEMHGGLIDVESTAGKGAKFSVRLPTNQ